MLQSYFPVLFSLSDMVYSSAGTLVSHQLQHQPTVYKHRSFYAHSLPDCPSTIVVDKPGSPSIFSSSCIFDLPLFTTFSSLCASDLLRVPARLCETLPACFFCLPAHSPIPASHSDLTHHLVHVSRFSLCFVFHAALEFTNSLLNHNITPL